MEFEYSKVLGQNDIENRLTVPQKWMDILRPLFGNDEKEALIRALCWLGYFWEFRCTIRGKGQYEKPTLQAHEWKKFISYAGIQKGDMLILQAEQNHERRTDYNIRVQRKDADGLWADVQPPARVAPAFCHFNI